MNYFYIALFTTATGLALFLRHYKKSFRWLGYSLAILLFPEYLVYYIRYIDNTISSPYIIYHINIPLFLILMYNFLKEFINDIIVQKIFLVTVIANTALAFALSYFFYQSKDFPGIQLNIMGTLMIGACLYIILTLEPIPGVPIYKHPMAWICLGYIVFFSATFFLNGIYNKLVETSSPYRSKVHTIINLSSNCFLYASLIVGLIFSNRIATDSENQE
jgi:hypothetical protein